MKTFFFNQFNFNNLKIFFLTVFLSLILYSDGFSQNSGNGFSFQAMIRDKKGAILKSTNVKMYIKIYVQGNSNHLYEESHTINTDEFGTVALTIGKGQKESGTSNKFSDINFGIGNLWYTVSILDGSAKREISNQKLLSVPYAEYAYNVNPVPSGTILPYAGTTVPVGYLACDGAEYSKSQYSSLYSAIQNIWGTASNSNNFKVPDLRGLFLRGVDGTANRDPDKTSRTSLTAGQNSGNKVGSYQKDELKSHKHNNGAYLEDKAGLQRYGKDANSIKQFYAYTSHIVNHATGFTSNEGVATETRPANIYVLYIIKI